GEALTDEERRPVEVLGKGRSRQAELTLVDVRVEAVHEPVAVEARHAAFLRHDLRPLAVLQPRAQAEGMIRVAVRVDADAARRPQPRAAGAGGSRPERRPGPTRTRPAGVRSAYVLTNAGCMNTSGATSAGGP